MRNLTATICLTIAVLLGSAGVSWSACVGSIAPGGPCSIGPGGGLSIGPGGGRSIGPGGGLSIGPGGGRSIGPNNLLRTVPGVKRPRGMPSDWKSAPGVSVWVYKFRTLPSELYHREVMATLRKGNMEYNNKNYQGAFFHFSPLANLGYGFAQLNLGLMYLYGFGVGTDYAVAKKWLEFAAIDGGETSRSAKHSLAYMYGEGKGVPRDFKIAATLFKSAAEGGLARSQAALSVSYVLGRGVKQNTVNAYMWAHIAELNGEPAAIGLKKMVAKELTPSQVDAAQKLARECVRKKYKGC